MIIIGFKIEQVKIDILIVAESVIQIVNHSAIVCSRDDDKVIGFTTPL